MIAADRAAWGRTAGLANRARIEAPRGAPRLPDRWQNGYDAADVRRTLLALRALRTVNLPLPTAPPQP